jgi:hypothetical protein
MKMGDTEGYEGSSLVAEEFPESQLVWFAIPEELAGRFMLGLTTKQHLDAARTALSNDQPITAVDQFVRAQLADWRHSQRLKIRDEIRWGDRVEYSIGQSVKSGVFVGADPEDPEYYAVIIYEYSELVYANWDDLRLVGSAAKGDNE